MQTVTRPPQTGSGSILQNSASTRAHGIELSVNSNNINRKFKWQTGFIMNYIKDKVTSYGVPANSSRHAVQSFRHSARRKAAIQPVRLQYGPVWIR